MNIKHYHPYVLAQEQYDQTLCHIIIACIRRLRQNDGVAYVSK